MNKYDVDDVLVLAKRYHNTKRTYLLVNPLQAKHLPVSPSKSLAMMECLGNLVAQKYPNTKLVIGFAETATAIGTVVAHCIGDDCRYIQTTREEYANITDWIYFNEEHSHAVEQKLFSKQLKKWISDSPQIVFVDDEISTGKTLLNIIDRLKTIIPELNDKEIVVASIINRLSDENNKQFESYGINSEYIVKLECSNLTEAVANFNIESAKQISISDRTCIPDNTVLHMEKLYNPRFGVEISKYFNNCCTIADRILEKTINTIKNDSNILVLGTEECMFPALIIGEKLERYKNVRSVKCHSTTRSPIGICKDASYPIQSGFKIHSFYDDDRDTYIYNLSEYDTVIVLTDATNNNAMARVDLTKALELNGCHNIVFVECGGTDV